MAKQPQKTKAEPSGSGSKKKWKEDLLKSGLPLESVAARMLGARKCEVLGEFTYMRHDENRIEKSFSIDLFAHYSFKWPYHRAKKSRIIFLIECKYIHQGAQWFFSPQVNYHGGHEVISVLDHLTAASLVREHGPLTTFNRSLPWCFKGAESPDGIGIEKGGKQLRYALPALARQLMVNQFEAPWDIEPMFVVPILLTTAKLSVLKAKLSIKHYHEAKRESDVARITPALLWAQSPDEGLESFALHKAGSIFMVNATVGNRLEELHALRDFSGTLNARWRLESLFHRITRSILVVNFDNFDKVLAKIIHAVAQVQNDIKVHARFKRQEDGTVVVLPTSAGKKS